MKTWFRFQNAADDPSTAEIHILDYIGNWDDDWFARNFGLDMGVTARAFVEQLAALPDSVKAIHVHINSPGGDVQAGVNIANALRDQQTSKGRTVETFVDGIAASIASVIAMAGSKVHISDNGLLMIHNPWSATLGDAREMRKMADVLDAMRAQIVATYKWHSALDEDKLVALMDAETWMDADEAIANGLATDKVEGLRAAAAFDAKGVSKFKVPEKFKARVDGFLAPAEKPIQKPQPASAADVLRICREASLPIAFAEQLVADQLPIEQATARVSAEKTRVAEATTRATGITALCVRVKLPDLAAGYINGSMPVEDVKKHLATITAKLDGRIATDGGLDPNHGTTPKPVIDTVAVYDSLNSKKE